MKRPIIITGCGRSGTSYISDVLQRSGYDCRHEEMGNDGFVSWYAATDKFKALKGPSIMNHGLDDPLILHQIREPLAAISSMMTITDDSWNWIKSHELTFINDSDSLILKCMKYYYYWNLRAMRISQHSYSVEFAESFLNGELGLNLDFSKTSKKTNARDHQDLDMSDLVRENDPLTRKILMLCTQTLR